MFGPRAIAALALMMRLGAPAAAHGDIPESDVACTGRVLLNDDLAPRSGAASHRIVSARAEILDESGAPVGTLYLDDRGDRYVALEPGFRPHASADFPGLTRTASDPTGGSPSPVAAGFRLSTRYRLAACR